MHNTSKQNTTCTFFFNLRKCFNCLKKSKIIGAWGNKWVRGPERNPSSYIKTPVKRLKRKSNREKQQLRHSLRDPVAGEWAGCLTSFAGLRGHLENCACAYSHTQNYSKRKISKSQTAFWDPFCYLSLHVVLLLFIYILTVLALNLGLLPWQTHTLLLSPPSPHPSSSKKKKELGKGLEFCSPKSSQSWCTGLLTQHTLWVRQ